MDAYSNVEIEIRQLVGQWAIEHWGVVRQHAGSKVQNGAAADDLTQDAFLQTLNCLLAHPETKIKNPKAYLCRVVDSRYINTQRGKLAKSTTSLDNLLVGGSTEDNLVSIKFFSPIEDEPEYIVEDLENEQTLKNLIDATALDTGIKRTAMLSIVGGWNNQLIARQLGITLIEVRRHTQLVLDEIKRTHPAHLKEIKE